MNQFDTLLNLKLQKRKEDNSFRKLVSYAELTDFTSNDYLGLARSEKLFELIKQKTESLPHRNGATGSRLLSGNTAYTEEVEQKLAKIFKADSCLIFNSGYAANQAILSSIPQRGDTILYDELAHACIRDGARLSPATRFPFLHNDLNDLESRLKKSKGNIFIAVESIYSMDGDTCPLRELVVLAERYNANIILDEAHSTGAMGVHGSGLATSLGIEDKIAVRVYTFGKAMGIHGACVAGSRSLGNYLINFARPFIFTTALAPHSVASIECSFDYLKNHLNLQQDLLSRISHFNTVTENIAGILQSKTQIQGIVIPGNDKVKAVSEQLRELGFDVRPILSPTVPQGMERLRICLHTYNSEEEITSLAAHLSKLTS